MFSLSSRNYFEVTRLKNQDTVTLKGMQFFVRLGLHQAERENEQPLEVDVHCSLDLREAGTCDDIGRTVDYSDIYQKIRDTVLEKKYNILESVCERIAGSVLEDTRIRKVLVNCRKPRVRLPGILEYAEVSIEREQSEE